MNLNFNTAHIQTICDLQNMAEKHSCKFQFGTNNRCGTELDDELFSEQENSQELYGELIEKFDISDMLYDFSSVWFELRDKDGKYHSLKYYEETQRFEAEAFYETPSEELETALDNIKSEYGDWYYKNDSKTIIVGFGKGRIDDHRVYRPDMALKFFSDLMCDYLNEPRIERTY